MSAEPDDWRPAASLMALRGRARQLAWVREFFAGRSVLEVETPVLGRHGVTDRNLDSIPAFLQPEAGPHWLQTSPEYAMKRLLAAGSGPIFQVARVFRRGERGARHNPEFSMLEWYRPGFSDQALMDEVAELVCGWLGVPEPERLDYRDACQRSLGLDPFTVSDTELRRRCERWLGDGHAATFSRDDCLDLLVSHELEPALAKGPPVFICHYPASQAALARISERDGVAVAHRFELYVDGLELCNGYWELTDASEQRRRFEAENRARKAAGRPVMPVDESLLQALEAGLPDCAGVALGLDRMLMLKLGLADIDGVLAFPAERA